jgi:preprotein translocase subunit YajC
MHTLIAQTGSNGSALGWLLPLILLAGFYFMILRPQQRRGRAQQALLSRIQVGDEIITTTGIYGTVRELDDEDGTVLLEIAPGTSIRMLRGGIGRRLVDEAEAYDEDDGPGDGGAGDDQAGPFQER